MQSFLDEIQTLPAQLHALLTQPDLVAAGRLLHTIKGLALTVGATELSAACRDAGTELTARPQAGAMAWESMQAQIAAANITTQQRLSQVLLELPEPSAPGSGTQRLDDATLHEQLLALRGLLRNSDLQALPLFKELHAQPPLPDAEIHWQALQSAMMALDFAQASRECDTLIQQLAPALKA